jgi:hypothetical protein
VGEQGGIVTVLEQVRQSCPSLLVPHGDCSPSSFGELDRAKAALPSSGRIIADDVTPEGLLRLFEDSEEVFIAASEGGLLDTLTGLRYGKGLPNLDLLNKSHDGDPHSPVRGSRDHKLIERPLLAMAVSPQPDVLRELVENVTLGRRGTLARFLFSLPSSMIGERAETTEPLDKPAMKWWTEFVQGLFDTVPAGEGIVRMLPRARAVIEEWRRPGTGLEARAAASGDPRLRAFRSRLHGEVYRLALLLHLLKHGATGFSVPIGEETARGAVKLADYYEAHAEIVYGLLSWDERTRRAKVILSWLEDRVEEGKLPRTTVRDVHRAHDRWPVEDVRAALALLEGRDLVLARPRRVLRPDLSGRGDAGGAGGALNLTRIQAVLIERAVKDARPLDPEQPDDAIILSRAEALVLAGSTGSGALAQARSELLAYCAVCGREKRVVTRPDMPGLGWPVCGHKAVAIPRRDEKA